MLSVLTLRSSVISELGDHLSNPRELELSQNLKAENLPVKIFSLRIGSWVWTEFVIIRVSVTIRDSIWVWVKIRDIGLNFRLLGWSTGYDRTDDLNFRTLDISDLEHEKRVVNSHLELSVGLTQVNAIKK